MTQERNAEAQEDASVSAMTPGSTHPKKPRGAAESRYDSRARAAGARTSGIVGMLGPEILVCVPAALCERWAQRVRHKSGHLRWAANPRTGGPRNGRLCQVTPWYFLTRLVPPSRSHRSSTWCRRVWRGLTSTVLCPRSLLLSLFDFFTPSPFLLSSLFVPLLAQCRPSLRAYLSLRPVWADYSWTPRRRLPGPWPAAWTRGGVELNCELNVSYVFSFVETGCVVDDRPSYPRVKGMSTDVDGYGLRVQVVEPLSSCCQRCPAVGVCACLVPGWPCPEPAVPVVKTHWCKNDAWVKRVSSKKTMRTVNFRERVPASRLILGPESRGSVMWMLVVVHCFCARGVHHCRTGRGSR